MKLAIRGDGQRSLLDVDIIEYDLVAGLGLQPSEIMAMSFNKVMLFHKLMCEQKRLEAENKQEEAKAWSRLTRSR